MDRDDRAEDRSSETTYLDHDGLSRAKRSFSDTSDASPQRSSREDGMSYLDLFARHVAHWMNCPKEINKSEMRRQAK
jgi:hypothetical protein